MDVFGAGDHRNRIHAMLAVAGLLAGVAHASAQPIYRGTDLGGFQPHQGYHAFEPFERLNTNTGNIVLTFTDLVLPGNAGNDLIFQRTYNNKWLASPLNPQDKWRWSFGFPGMVMRVIEQSTPGGPFPTTLAAQIQETPVFVMADGSTRATAYKSSLNENVVLDAAFRNYDQTTNTLYAPDGIVAQYNTQGYLTSFQDAFGNAVTLDRTSIPNAILVTQALGAQQRQVRLDLDGLGQVTAMTYLDPAGSRTWEYDYVGQDLTRVTQPLGPDWVFTYASGYLETITTPGGGQISYSYNNPDGVPFVRWRTGANVVAGSWLIGITFADATLARVTEIATPSGALHRYENYPSSPPSILALGGGTGFLTHSINNSAGEYFEKEERMYTGVGIVKHIDTWFMGAQIGWQSIKHRDPAYPSTERYHNTNYTYRHGGVEDGGDYHQSYSFSRFDSGEPGAQTFARTFEHLQTPYIVGLVKSESDNVTGIVKGWTYNASTGFLMSSSLTAPGSQPEVTTYTPTADGVGNVASVTAPNGKTNTLTYEWGRIKTTQGPQPGSAVTFAINADGTSASETRAGRTTTYTYDDLTRLIGVQGPGGTNPVTIEYDNVAAAFVTTTRGQSESTTFLDAYGAPIEVREGSGVRVRTEFDAEGRVIYQGLPYTPGLAPFDTDKGTTIVYDLLGRVASEVSADQSVTTRTYQDSTIEVENAREFTTVLTLNGRDQVSSVRDADSRTWTYTYHPAGQLHEIIGPDGETRRWEYDARQRLSSQEHPESGTLLYEDYDEAGLVTRTRDAANNVVSFTYDDNDRIETVTAGSRITTFAYETGSDNVVEMMVSATPSAPEVTTAVEYDAAGRVKKRIDTVDGKTFTSQYTYDANGNLKRIVYPSGLRVQYRYDAHNRLTRVYNVDTGANYATTFVYNGAGALASYTAGNGITTTVTHDPQSYRLNAIQSGALGLTYTYDAMGNVETIEDSRPGMDQTFTYDPLDRLQSAAGPYGSIPYTFDAHGNQQTSPGGISFEYDASNRFRLKNRGGLGNYQYLPNGNLASETAGTYSYTADNLLDSATLNVVTTRFAYDAQGWRIRKLVEGGPTYYYTRGSNGQLLSEWTNTSATTATARDYIYAGGRMMSVVVKTNLPPK